MKSNTTIHRRSWRLLPLLAAAATAGCMNAPLKPAERDGRYCIAVGRSLPHTRTCTSAAIPPQAVEDEAKRFQPAPGSLTVYVVRPRQLGDTRNLIRIQADSRAIVDTVPKSFARLRLPPGAHRLTASWPDGKASLDISGVKGEVIFVEVVGSEWLSSSRYRLERRDASASRERAAALRLVGDAGGS